MMNKRIAEVVILNSITPKPSETAAPTYSANALKWKGDSIEEKVRFIHSTFFRVLFICSFRLWVSYSSVDWPMPLVEAVSCRAHYFFYSWMSRSMTHFTFRFPAPYSHSYLFTWHFLVCELFSCVQIFDYNMGRESLYSTMDSPSWISWYTSQAKKLSKLRL